MEKGVVSKTLDYAYDDWCVSQLALALGKKKEGKALLARSMNYKNVFHLIGGNHQGCFVRTFHDAGVFQSGRPFACPSGMFEHLQLGGYPIVHDAGGDDRPEAV